MPEITYTGGTDVAGNGLYPGMFRGLENVVQIAEVQVTRLKQRFSLVVLSIALVVASFGGGLHGLAGLHW